MGIDGVGDGGSIAAGQTLGEVIAGRAAATPDAVAVISTTQAWTNEDLLTAGRRVAQLVPSGHTAAVDATDRSSLAVSVIAAAMVTAATPLALDLPPDRRATLLDRLHPVVVLDGEELSTDRDAQGTDLPPVGLDDTALLLTTSGSTAEPKLVPNTHRNLRASARFAAQAQRLGPDDRCLALGSMAHVLGLRTMTDALWCGATVIVPRELTVENLALHLREHGPTCVVAAPPLLHTLLAAVESLGAHERHGLAGSMRYVRSGAAALRPELIERLRASLGGAAVLHGYGMTEVAKIACTPLDGTAPTGSVGRPLGVELRLEPFGFDSAEGATGEILVRGDVVAPGYADERHESASSFADGWFRTGDVGRLDADGHLFLHGRRDDVVSRGGVLVSLDSLEAALEAHQAVLASVAVAVDHPNLGSDVVLAFKRQDGAEDVDAAALRSFLADRLGVSQAPTRILEVEDIPLTSSGKPDRARVAEMLAVGSVLGSSSGGDLGPTDDDVEPRLAGLWCELLLLEHEVHPDDDLFALGADSLHLVELCTMIAQAFGPDLMPGELIGRSSLREMAALVREGAERGDRPLLVKLRDGEADRCPLYLVPGAGGTLAAFHRFVATLEPGRPVFGFETAGFYEGDTELLPIADLADRFAHELTIHKGDEPFCLVGFCLGAVITQEMTRRLEIEGQAPELLVMFDARLPGVRQGMTRFERLRARVGRSLEKRLRRRVPPASVVVPRQEMSASVRRARRAHQIQPSSAPTLMFTSKASIRQAADPHLGWKPYLRGEVDVVTVARGHQELLQHRVPETAAAVDEALTRLERAPTPT